MSEREREREKGARGEEKFGERDPREIWRERERDILGGGR